MGTDPSLEAVAAPDLVRGSGLFSTPLGDCGMVWGAGGIRSIRLPEWNREATLERILRDFPGVFPTKPPPEVAFAMEAVAAYLRGEPSDLGSIRLDMEGLPPFHRKVYQAARGIPPGATTTYGKLALIAGSPEAARAVGQALARNPFPIVVPCHRILSSRGWGGFTAPGGLDTKRRLLRLEASVAGECL